MNARVLALYLPQFHPIADNDRWWGKGFTEWTNVGKARPLFRGHYQPRVPADLGYYDLRIPEVREAQAALAASHGISGFLYWHYWFGGGKTIMERPLTEVLRAGSPQFPLALAWANASWKGFNYGTGERNLLLEQQYLGEQDEKDHFHHILPALTDPRYVHIKGRPFFMVFQPFELPHPRRFIDHWQRLAQQAGIGPLHFVAQTDCIDRISELRSIGFDAINVVRLFRPFHDRSQVTKRLLQLAGRTLGFPWNITTYAKAMPHWLGPESREAWCYPTLYPNWDHTPRSGLRGAVVHNSTPELFEQHCREVFAAIKKKGEADRTVILKSWNEWAEGNYMEPDLRFGTRYLEALQRALSDANA